MNARVLLVLGMLFSSSICAAAGKRVALVVGNGAYQHTSPLRNPVNDATDIAKKLRELEFDVIEATDADLSDLNGQVRRFSDAVQGADAALFYYSGHAMQVRDQNYLLPVDAQLRREGDLDFETYSLNKIVRQMELGAAVSLVFLDACRDNPLQTQLARRVPGATKNLGLTRGLGRVRANVGTMVAFATEPGNVALDGDGRNSPFTTAVLRHMGTPGIGISEVMRRVRRDVIQSTADKDVQQVPWERTSLTEDFYFVSARPVTSTTGRLTVKVEPEDARVRIMNIAPRYSDGIELALNREYDIYVTRDGYESWRQQISLTSAQQVVPVVLQRRSLPVPAPPPTAGIEPRMVLLRGGCYQMGSPASEAGREDDEKQHRVCVDDVMAATTETTVAQFRAFVDASGYRTDAERNAADLKGCYSEKDGDWGYHQSRSWRDPGFEQRDDEPVVCVSWNDAVAYIEWLAGRTGKGYRLPTEAEWEYAARAGSSTARYWGDDSDEACRYANVADQAAKAKYSNWPVHSCDDGVVHTARVARYAANDNGLHDMLGNVWEWTCSAYDDAYGGAERVCEKGQSARRALRGGSWDNAPTWVRSANRYWGNPGVRGPNLGFRVFQDVR